MLRELNYQGAPRLKDKDVEALLELMHKRAVEIGLPLDNPLSAKGFRLGYAEGLLAHPGHPVEVQAYVGLFTWLVVQYDDIVGQKGQMKEEASFFQQRFFKAELQPNALLEGLATLLREAYDYFDPVLANLLQISVINFLTSNLLEQHDGFQKMTVTKAGERFPYWYRSISGLDIGYAVFCYPKALYPDLGCFIEAVPDMAIFINISNDVLSFYKEELGGDTRNYINNRAMCTGQDTLTVLEQVKKETVDSAKRAKAVLKGRGRYAQSWDESVRGYMAMHTTNPRYRLSDMDLAEVHPLAPFEARIAQLLKGSS
ncbi:longiborneol synthase [Xylariales sp. AK1849]|nr:longiborneol synthase [Xylariales sp. AK1849]